MGNKKIVETTTNRSVFNRAYKSYLEHVGKIRCSCCKYHKGENDTDKWYGKLSSNDSDIKYPSWKLVSKNKKQWMKKPIKIITESRRYGEYIEFKFKKNEK